MCVPARRALDEGNARERAGFGVARHGVGHCEVDGRVVAAEYLGQLLHTEGGLARAEHGRHLVPRVARQALDQLPHRAVSE